jgi:hypothetical protein
MAIFSLSIFSLNPQRRSKGAMHPQFSWHLHFYRVLVYLPALLEICLHMYRFEKKDKQ